MQLKKLAPMALAAALATAMTAAAAPAPNTASVQRLCEKYSISFCGGQTDCPAAKPEQKPSETPSDTPETKPSETPDSTPSQTPSGSTQSSFAAEVVSLVNAERAKYGLSALTIDAKVQQAAQVRAQETVQSFSHTRPSGASFSSALTEAGVSYTRAGENIAYGQATPQAVVSAWMNSEGHRANILSKNFTKIGVGYTLSGGTAYWAQLFTT